MGFGAVFGGWLYRMQASARFRRWATALPLTRPIARRRAQSLFDLCAGFVYSQILLAVVRLGLPERVRDRPRAAACLANELGLAEDAAERLLLAAVSIRLLSRRGTDAAGRCRYGLGPLGAALIDNPGVLAMIGHHDRLYDDLRDPVAMLRGGSDRTALSAYWPYAAAADASERTTETDRYSALMAASQAMVAAETLHAYPFGRHRRLLDVGGGDGSFLIAAGQRCPHLRLMLFDLPPVAELARMRLAASGLAPRSEVFAGNFIRNALPTGADLVTLVRVLHDHDDAAAVVLLEAARRALPADGTLLVAEPMAGTPGAEAAGDGYFGLYLWAMGQGRPRTPERIAALLRRAGFRRTRLLRTRMPMVARVLMAR